MRITHLGPALVVLSALVGCGGSTIMAPPAGCVNASSTIICTQSGQVQGVIEGNVRAFRGIPFAAPPISNLRWRPPAPPASWQGVRSAASFGNICPQTDFNGGVQGNEDCLTLNIFTTSPPPNAPQPVMVFIHGGANLLGSAQGTPDVPAPPLVTRGTVLVTVQYRLGLLGFFAHPALTTEGGGTSGNYGVWDMIAALTWVHNNISNFGGDPNNVMVFGQSAGSSDVQALLVSPPAQGLFVRAGMESSVIPGGDLSGGLAQAYAFDAPLVPFVGCASAQDVLACLRAVPANTIVQAQLTPGLFIFIGLANDPRVIPADPFAKLAQQGSPVPLLIGSNSEDGVGLNGENDPNVPLSAAAYAAAIHAQFDPLMAGAGDQVLMLYPASAYDTPEYAHIAVEGDYIITCPTRNLARAAAGAQRPAIWRYLFTHRYKNDTFLNSLRAFHTAELSFVFGNFEAVYYTQTPYTPTAAELQLVDQIMGYWTRFAATGDPNGAGAVPWLRYDTANDNVLQLGDTPATINGFHNTQCDYLSTLPQP